MWQCSGRSRFAAAIVKKNFAQASRWSYHPTSPRTTSPRVIHYNCIAWAAGDTTRPWWPAPGHYWPRGIAPTTPTVLSFIIAFGHEAGYAPCNNSALEPGVEKVALYGYSQLEVTHAARQLPSGVWTSKLGRHVDIEHRSLSALEGPAPAYGTVIQILARRRQ